MPVKDAKYPSITKGRPGVADRVGDADHRCRRCTGRSSAPAATSATTTTGADADDEEQRLALYHRINKLWIAAAAAAPLDQQIDLYGPNKRLNLKARSDELIKAFDMSIK